MTTLIGATIGQYQIIEEIGRGGMATVYLARQPSMGRDVAIKVLPAAFTHDPTFLKRFQREIEIAAHLQHTRILPVFDFGEYENQPYIVMAYIAGGSLEDRIQQGALSFKEATKYIEQIADGMDYLHGQGIVHRDFKPSNVLLDDQNNTYLMDFGIARTDEATSALTGTSILGTPAYMAPEVFEGGDASPASDQYALGVTAFQMLTGHLPFEAETPVQHMRAHIEKPVPDARRLRSDLPPGVGNALAKAMAKNPAHRFESARAFAAALIETGKIAPAERRPMPILWIGLGVVIIAALGLGGWIMFGTQAGSPITVTEPITPIPPTDAPIPIPIIGGGTGVIGFNSNRLGYTVDVSCVVANNADCDASPHILPQIENITPIFGKWSPDGKWIAFVSGRWDTSDLRVNIAAYDGSQIATLEEPAPDTLWAARERGSSTFGIVSIEDAVNWSPDGSTIAFVADPVAGTKTGVIADGSQRNFIMTFPYIWLLDAECLLGGQPGCANPLRDYELYLESPVWSPDGQYIAVYQNHTSGDTTIQSYTMNVQTNSLSEMNIYQRMNPNGVHTWIPDSNRLMIIDFDELLGDASLMIVDMINGSRIGIPVKDVQSLVSVTVSPDGHYAALRFWLDDFELGILDLTCIETGVQSCRDALIMLTDNNVDEGHPSWSPDGQWLAFAKAAHTDLTVNLRRTTLRFEDALARNSGVDLFVLNLEDALTSKDTAAIQITKIGIVEILLGVAPQWQPAPGK